MTKIIPGRRLGEALRNLRPVRHALDDPYFRTVARPVDSAWTYCGVTGSIAGFNPLHHVHYYPIRSVIDRWLNAPTQFSCSEEEEVQLAKEVMLMAHDYLHSWAYRIIFAIIPDFEIKTPRTREELTIQAFFLILTEAVAVAGLDYWYLSVRDIKARCRTNFSLGPCTVHYVEQKLPEYRLANPTLNVQCPEFFFDVVRLYADGVIVGFSEGDLIENRSLADWLVRELLIAPRQRVVSQTWIGQMAGMDLAPDDLLEPFSGLVERNGDAIARIGKLLWDKTTNGVEFFFPGPKRTQQWHYVDQATVDFRFANLNHIEDRKIAWRSASGGTECWSYYVDQVVAGRQLPEGSGVREDIAGQVALIRGEMDVDRLTQLVSSLSPIEYVDAAPLELLFVN